MPDVINDPLLPLVGLWQEKIRLGFDKKHKRFGAEAEEGMKFFQGPYEFLYGTKHMAQDKHFKQEFDESDDSEIPAPRFQMTVNKVAEIVQIFGPVLYHTNPTRQVNPREHILPDADLMAAFATPNQPPAGPGQQPMMSPQQMMLQQLYQQGIQSRAIDKFRAKLLETYQNYTPNALDLKTESRQAIDEALIKGMGVLWPQVYQPPAGGKKMIGSFYDSVDNLVIDPDATSLRDAKWVARRRIMPVWEAERKFGWAPGTMKPNLESLNRQAEVQSDPDGHYLRATGQTNDLITYFEIYSKTGMGGRLLGSNPQMTAELEAYGDYCYLCIAPSVRTPLNIPDALLDMPPDQGRQAIMQAVQWPTPFWADDEWPFATIAFHWIPGDPWPMSHLSPGMGELKFLNWAFSFIAGKIRISSRDIVAVLAEASEEIKSAILHGTDYELITIKGSNGKTIDQIVQFLQHPQFNADIWRVIEAVMDLFDKRVGLSELMYGLSSKQMRSAQEAEIKSDAVNVRPDDMANKVEDAMSQLARLEALAIRWHLTGQDVAPVMGPVGQALWDQFITPADPSELLYSLEYRIEANSVRKPNRERDAANAQQLTQTYAPFFEQLAAQGLTGPFNTMLQRWADSIDMKTDGLLLPDGIQMPQPTKPAG